MPGFPCCCNLAYDQFSYRGRNDDGSETAATWKEAVNTQWTQVTDTNFRCRFLIKETEGDSENNVAWKLQRSVDGGQWIYVTGSSSVVKSVSSANLTDSEDCTQQIGSGTFITDNDGIDESDGQSGGTPDFAGNDETETEFSLQVIDADVSGGEQIQLRVVKSDGTPLDTYTSIATLNIPVDCAVCTDGWPTEWTVEISGIPAEDCSDGDCVDLNGTYVINDISEALAANCNTKESLTELCGIDRIRVSMVSAAGDYILQVVFDTGVDALSWIKNLGSTKPDCTAFSGEVLAYTRITLGDCTDHTGSTATVTAN